MAQLPRRLLLSLLVTGTGCSVVSLRTSGLVRSMRGDAPLLRYERVETYPVPSGLPGLCAATGIFYGGGCWAYLALPDGYQKVQALQVAAQDVRSLFGTCAHLEGAVVEREDWDVHAPSIRVLDASTLAPVSVQPGAYCAAPQGPEYVPVPSEPMPLSVSGSPRQGTWEALDQKNGFRDAVLGSPLASFQNLELVADEQDLQWYRRTTDSLVVGDAKLKSIQYGFTKGRLAFIALESTEAPSSAALLRVLQAAFGPGTQPTPSVQEFWWTGRKVSLQYKRDAGVERTQATYIDQAAMVQLQRDREQRAKDADL
jgi:hypothetical protein